MCSGKMPLSIKCEHDFDILYGLEEEWKKELKKMVDRESVVLFGAGSTISYNIKYMMRHGIQVAAICDNNSKKWGLEIAGVPVIGIEELKTRISEAYIYITTQLYYWQIYEQLLKEGFVPEQMSKYDCIIQLEWESDTRKHILDHIGEYQRIYGELSDWKSRDVLFKRLLFLITRDRSILKGIHDKIPYFDSDIYELADNEVFVDAGVYRGETTIEFIRQTGGQYLKVYGFETETEYAIEAESELAKTHENVEIINKGLSDASGRANASSVMGVMTSIADGVFESSTESDASFVVCRMDDEASSWQHSPTLIKMDIEGAEMGALKGAAHTIRKHRPKMAVCVYHRQTDLLDIHQFLKECHNDYRFYLRHYSDNSTETVLYAV